jgi:hypothetical protein
MAKKISEYYCVCVRRNYEEIWRFVSKHDTKADAQAELDKRRSYTGVFNYDNAELRVVSRSEAKKEFGSRWEYKTIGEAKAAKQSTSQKED